MENYQIVVSNLAAERGEKDPNLVLNLFQSLLDEFTRGHKNDFEQPKVGGATQQGAGQHGQGHAGPTQTLPLCCAPLQQSKAQKKKRKQERAVSMFAGACVHDAACVSTQAHLCMCVSMPCVCVCVCPHPAPRNPQVGGRGVQALSCCRLHLCQAPLRPCPTLHTHSMASPWGTAPQPQLPPSSWPYRSSSTMGMCSSATR